ncbi:MAG: AAA family ATPase [Bacteroidales bacterium]|nr:AAA family ATPase [Bacteroidales bacterium]
MKHKVIIKTNNHTFKMLFNDNKEIEIPADNPFLNCKLDRQKYAEALTSVIEAFSDSDRGCVMSLDGEWGSGKTTFIKMWQQLLKKNEFSTIYFNAWECDYVDDPLAAMITELKEMRLSNDKLERFLSAGERLLIASFKSLLKGVIKIDLKDIIDESSKLVKDYIKEVEKQKKTISDFKIALSEYIASSDKSPVVFFVDELDRCNPEFAVKVLERIKHLFDIPNLFFVIAVNRTQLEYSVKGYYGSDKIDSSEYLRRFIDLNYSLPEPDFSKYYDYLADKHNFKKLFSDLTSNRYYGGNDGYALFVSIISALLPSAKLNLRATNKLFLLSRLTMQSFVPNNLLFSDVVFFLCYWKVVDTSFYNSIVERAFNIQELIDEIEKRLPANIKRTKDEMIVHRMAYTIAGLSFLYNLRDNFSNVDIGFKSSINEEGVYEFPVSSSFIDYNLLNQAFNFYDNHHNPIRLSYLTNKIDFYECINNNIG